jgi:UDP-glucose 4-epimerase
MAVLVTGGAGYIGSVLVDLLRNRGQDPIVLDDLARGHRAALDATVPFYHGTIGDRLLIQRICREHTIESCIHFAALAYVGESVADPRRYFENNVEQGIRLLGELLNAGVRRIVFSSTCATYGEPQRVPIDETHPQNPTNPYGWSKLVMEQLLAAYDQAYGLRYVALRYFNAAGATAKRGEHHDPESHLIPNVLAVALGKLPYVSVFGSDYPTPDGTAIRDYVHVSDLADAHLLSLEYLRGDGRSRCINLGNGQGYSVMEVIETAKRVTGCNIGARMEPARAGDPSRLVANADLAASLLNWKPQFPTLEAITQSAWDWHRTHLDGYEEKADGQVPITN